MIFDRSYGENEERPQPEALSFERFLFQAAHKVATSWISDRESATNFSTTSLFRRDDLAMEEAYKDYA